MKKFAVLLLAVVICFAGCGKAENSDSKAAKFTSKADNSVSDVSEKNDTPIATTRVALDLYDEQIYEDAKAVIADYFKLMSEGNYDDAQKLCTDNFSMPTYTDTKPTEPVNVTFDDSYRLAEENKEENVIDFTLTVKVEFTDNTNHYYSGHMMLKYADGKYLLDSADMTEYK